ncbi:MAG TPA: NAD-glutamate dehydrogenase [Thermoanaerobaculia bacterium]|nr:NAD-glutamate dehydrogenase [Thermoanaerobaculia bacterium]
MISEKSKSELIDQVVERVRARLNGGNSAHSVISVIMAERFVRQFYAHVPPADILGDAPDNLAGAALALWDFAQERTPGAPKIRVYNPRFEQHGWESSHSVVEIVNDDMAFLVDSVSAELRRLDGEVQLLIHPIVHVERDADGRLLSLREPGAEGPAESLMHVRVSAQSAARHEKVRHALERVLADVRSAVDDWNTMRARCWTIVAELEKAPPPLPRKEIAEGIAFLEWLVDNHFTFLGFREYSFEGEGEDAVARVLTDTGLGILRNEGYPIFDGLRNLGTLPEEVRHFLRQPALLLITKSNRLATVHRPVPMDAVAVKRFDSHGSVTGERIFVGLFTATAYSRNPRTIPILRQKVESSLERAGFTPESHDEKALLNILETYPRDELFQIGEEELFRISSGILPLEQRPRIALFVRRDPFERFVSCLVFVPRDRYDTELRIAFRDILARAYRGKVTTHHTHLTDEALARLHFHVATTPGRIPNVDPEDVERQLTEAARSWGERLEEALVEKHGEEEGLRLARRYARAFPAAYHELFGGAEAVFDIGHLELALATGDLAFDLYRSPTAGPSGIGLKIYGGAATVPLSDVLPMLESMGLKVLEEMPHEIRPSEAGGPVAIRDFSLMTEDGAPVDLGRVKQPFEEVFGKVWRGQMENDGFNRLVLRAGLVSREITVLRAYCKYLRQAGIPFSQAYMERTLARNPEITRRLVDLFLTLFDPARQTSQEAAGERAAALVSEIGELLDRVTNVDEDRILRRYLNLIEATLRTNHFQKDADGNPKSYLSLKLDSQRIEELPLPRPFREIFVFSPQVEAIHLRGGRVARGGIRWSDRPEDFRTEVLGLMKAQVVKNAVIVPVGSKGGFIVKRPPAGGREELLREGIECYKTMMRGLLDLTDNLVGSKVVPPPDVVRRDDDDPYLVVAADKGTATFSDIANGVAAEYGFWLDDAFASGGSSGYDHKGMAITSRGVWESVKRHFREIGKDTQSEDFTVIGVGDMSGDVFGNGMLMSPHIRLLGAFNHQHVFVDPDPDAARSFEERKRLFHLPRSTWADYNSSLISAGGGVFERSAKTIPVSPQMARAFGLSGEHVSPAELIQALLKADVELLWFGGIGTYLKARTESHADVGDRANDSLRVDAADLRARVIGEGANLGMTQRARVEYALRGGRLNTDFIDNSAGVDCSDHEVNIKILLGEVERSGKLTRPQRDELLREMTDEVAALVLRDNYLQTQSLSVTQQVSAHLLERLARFIKALERGGRLDRRIWSLPDDEALASRGKQNLGLARPELCVLLSYAKMALYDELLPSDLPDDPYMQEDLKLYFPTPLRKKYAKAIAGHRLSREIIATAVTNSIVNRAGITFMHEVKEKTGLPAADIARAYVVTREVFGLRDLWSRIEALDNQVSAADQAAMLLQCGRMVERGTVWFLTECRQPLDVGSQIKAYSARVQGLSGHLREMVSEADRVLMSEQAAAFAVRRIPEDLAQRISCLGWMVPLIDIVRISRNASVTPLEVGKTYFDIGSRFGFDWLRRAASGLPTDKVWDKLAVTAIVDDLFAQQSELTSRVVATIKKGGDAGRAINAWVEERRPLVTRTEQLLAELKSVGTPSLAMLAVANRQLKSMGSVGPSGH